MNYFVPNFGQDQHINETDGSLEWAERNLNHKWNWVKPAEKKDNSYTVPNFGVDQDIKDTQAAIATQEALHGKWVPVQDDNGVWILPQAANNKSYTYKANVQLDGEDLVQLESDPICSSAGCGYASEKGAKTHPMNYFVPNFGRDADLNHTDNSLDWAERNLKHKWNWVKPEKNKDPKDYFVPDFGLEEDIVDTQANIADQEKIHGKWVPVQDENGVWEVPEAANNKSYTYNANVQLDAEVESDPICSSAGCGYASEKGPKTHPMNYFVPNFGNDHDMHWNNNSLEWAERQLNHHWVVGPKQKPKDPVLYDDYNKPLEHDMITSLSNLKEQEGIHGVWNIPMEK